MRRAVDVRLDYYPKVMDPAVRRGYGEERRDPEASPGATRLEASREAPTPITATFVNALNDTIDN